MEYVTLAPAADCEDFDDTVADMELDYEPEQVVQRTLVDTTAFLSRLGEDTPHSRQWSAGAVPLGTGPVSAPQRAPMPAASETVSGPSGAGPSAVGVEQDHASDGGFELPRTSTEFVTFRRKCQLLDELRRRDQQMQKMAAELDALRLRTRGSDSERRDE